MNTYFGRYDQSLHLKIICHESNELPRCSHSTYSSSASQPWPASLTHSLFTSWLHNICQQSACIKLMRSSSKIKISGDVSTDQVHTPLVSTWAECESSLWTHDDILLYASNNFEVGNKILLPCNFYDENAEILQR